MSEFVENLAEQFADKEYAHAYLAEHGNMLLAAQIRALREMRGLTQSQLADLAGMKQERISALENVEYDAWTVKTLRKLAEAFDTGLQVSFVPVSQSIMNVANVSADALKIAPRAEDLEDFRRHTIVKSQGKWKAIDGSHLSLVTSITATPPIAPTKQGWQRLDKPLAVAANG